TYSAPPTTGAAPFSAAPIDRSITPRTAPGGYASPGYAAPYGGYGGAPRSSFMTGFMGGLVGAGLGGMLFGRGLFGGIDGGGSFIGFLLQIALLAFAARFVFRLLRSRQLSFGGLGANLGNVFARPGGAAPPPGRAAAPGLTLQQEDYHAFERLLQDVQAAWSAGDLNRIRALATPEMLGMFGEQLAELNSRGLRNSVTDVRLDRGDLSEAWAEGSRQYATVAMRFSMLDATSDVRGHLVDGSTTERVAVAELWTFLRSTGGRWILSAVQQTR
ncbi:MAG: Tim44 domain-containing protein, partial [Janthinobacterium lividum]